VVTPNAAENWPHPRRHSSQSKKNIKDFEVNYGINDTPGPNAGNASRQHLVPQRLDGFIGSFAIDPLADTFVTRHADVGSCGRAYHSIGKRCGNVKGQAPVLLFCALRLHRCQVVARVQV
jgi:hypothetical protein